MSEADQFVWPANSGGSDNGYALALFGHYLSKVYDQVSDEKNSVIMRKIWENFDSSNAREAEVESFISGLGLAKRFNKIYGKNLKTSEIFEMYRKHDLDAERFIDEFKLNLAMSLSAIINILDPDAFIFGGGVSNEIDFLSEIESIVKKFVIGKEYEGVFLKPKFGDASGVRGAARLGRSATY